MKLPDNWDWKNPDYDWVYAKRVERLALIRRQPELVPRIRDHYANHPADFINDWGCTFDPRLAERGLRTVVPFLLFPKQREFIGWLLDRWQLREDGLVEKSRDMGVSWLTVAFGAWMMIFRPGTVTGFGSRKEEYVDKVGDPKSLFWKVRQFIELLPIEFQPAGWDVKTHAPFMRIQAVDNGSFITGEAGDNIGRGNRTSIYFVDEAAFLERPDAADAALSQTCNCRVYVSTPNGAGNVFYRKRHGGKIRVFIFDWRDDPRKDAAWYQKQKETLEPAVLAQEVDRSYSASVENAYISDLIASAAARRGPADVIAMGSFTIGVDVARFGNDKTVLTARQGRLCIEQEIHKHQDIVNVAGLAKQFVQKYQAIGDVAQIAVDTVGLGAGVADMLRRDFGDIVQDVNSGIMLADGQNYNLRARMYRDMREWLKAGASIPNDPDLITDLTALRYGFRAGELLLESKDDAKKRGVKSPDRSDSLALTFAIPPKPRDDFAIAAARANSGNSIGWQVLDEIAGF
jgi:phage terminase large subunit